MLGHEAAGTIVAVGDGVPVSRIGQRVSIEPQRPDPDSAETRSGRYNLCPHMRFFATPPVDGALCDYVTIGAAFAHPVPDTISDDAAALCEPLSVGIAAVRKAGLIGGVPGAHRRCRSDRHRGHQVARAYGATDIIVTDLDESRRERAARSVRRRFSIRPSRTIGDWEWTRSSMPPVRPPPSREGIHAVRPAGTRRPGRLGAETMALPTQLIQNRELVLTGVFRYANTWPTAIALVESGRVDLDAMVTARFPLEKAAEALDSDRTPGSVKAVVQVS